VINQHPNISRPDNDRLKATLHNAWVHGPTTQFSERPLTKARQRVQGEIAWIAMVHPKRGERLRETFEKILWPPG
jgi:hypothetical protein